MKTLAVALIVALAVWSGLLTLKKPPEKAGQAEQTIEHQEATR